MNSNSEIGNRKSQIPVVVIGAGGRMGRTLIRCIQNDTVPGLKLAGAIDIWDCPDRDKDAGLAAGAAEAGVKITTDLAAVIGAAEVAIDFSGHHGTAGNAPPNGGMGQGLGGWDHRIE